MQIATDYPASAATACQILLTSEDASVVARAQLLLGALARGKGDIDQAFEYWQSLAGTDSESAEIALFLALESRRREDLPATRAALARRHEKSAGDSDTLALAIELEIANGGDASKAREALLTYVAEYGWDARCKRLHQMLRQVGS